MSCRAENAKEELAQRDNRSQYADCRFQTWIIDTVFITIILVCQLRFRQSRGFGIDGDMKIPLSG